jgi:hypothetical protein
MKWQLLSGYNGKGFVSTNYALRVFPLIYRVSNTAKYSAALYLRTKVNFATFVTPVGQDSVSSGATNSVR